jgi:acetate kinase
VTGPILTLNAGSSSLKFALFKNDGRALTAGPKGVIEKILSAPRMTVRDGDGAMETGKNWPSPPPYSELVAAVLAWAETASGTSLEAVGHRVVHGGARHALPQFVTEALLEELDALVALAPLHEPHNIAPMRALAKANPALPQIACFDTAFHRTMPPVATRFALPPRFEAEGVRRYGFHGLSYEYIAGRLREIAPDLARGRVIAAHLGNGASACAMKDGRSIDTSMGFSALDGLVMGTRCGNIDPGVILYLMRRHGMGAGDIEDLLYNRSGLLGLSGISPDMRALLASPEPAAKEAVALFVFRLAREIGALAASLGGLDGLVFTAGIGEHAPSIRHMACGALGWLGIALDEAANKRGDLFISVPDSRVKILVVPTDEEQMIARHTFTMLAQLRH